MSPNHVIYTVKCSAADLLLTLRWFFEGRCHQTPITPMSSQVACGKVPPVPFVLALQVGVARGAPPSDANVQPAREYPRASPVGEDCKRSRHNRKVWAPATKLRDLRPNGRSTTMHEGHASRTSGAGKDLNPLHGGKDESTAEQGPQHNTQKQSRRRNTNAIQEKGAV